MVRLIEPQHHLSLDDYEVFTHLSTAVRDLQREARTLGPLFEGRRVWMVNSTAHGGGVAELLPPMVTLMSELGLDTRWLVLDTDDDEFFRLTKRLHNLVQGQGDAELGDAERELYEKVNRQTAEDIAEYLSPGDVLVVHDPQPMGAGAFLRESHDILAIWRCHIGLDAQTPETEAAWQFLCTYAEPYDHAVFSAPEYIPDCLSRKSTIIHPAIDPLSHKNRELDVHKLVGILSAAALVEPTHPTPGATFSAPARRLQRDGEWAPATQPQDFGLLFRPILTQISRWDRLKGFLPLLNGFAELKAGLPGDLDDDELPQRILGLTRLVLAGPDPESIQDDPEAQEVLDEICDAYVKLPAELQDDVAIISIPMTSAKENALIVNALHRCSDIVVQNSLREGFGLTATEAMWKRLATVGTRAAGLRQQIRDGLNGYLIRDPESPSDVADVLRTLLRDQKRREALGHSAQQRVHNDFLIFTQIRRWLELIADTVND
jgi:trehalose synthase